MKKKLNAIIVIFALLSVSAFSMMINVTADIPDVPSFDVQPLYDIEHDDLKIDRDGHILSLTIILAT